MIHFNKKTKACPYISSKRNGPPFAFYTNNKGKTEIANKKIRRKKLLLQKLVAIDW